MKRFIYTTILVILIASLCVPSVVGAEGGRRLVHVILQADGPTDTLVAQIKSLGGTIKFKYRNVPAVAAAIPADRMDAIAGFPGVTKVEKDRMICLHDAAYTNKNPASLRSFAVQNMEGIKVKTVDLPTLDLDALPKGYANFLYTGAVDVWSKTNAGAGTIVAVVDTGVVPNACIGHAVIGAPGFPEGYNATGDGVSAMDPSNDYHGTYMGSVIASACALNFSAYPSHPLYRAISTYLPWTPDFVPIFGQAPNAKLYPVKVFDVTGEDAPTSVILDGLDHILTLKKSGALDIDIVNMSLGGPTVYDGRDAFDRFVLELWKANILVVTSAGNSGPIPNTVGSPATAFNSIAVGGLDYAVSSRVFYEFVGLTIFPGLPGQGLVMRPADETRVVNFSSRGPLSDGRAGPDICALGTWSFHSRPDNTFSWELGTSASAATVSGGAALLNAYWKNVEGKETNPFILRHVLMGGANKNEVGPAWQGINDQGQGALDVSTSLNLLKHGKWLFPTIKYTGSLRPNILPGPGRNSVDTFKSHTITLRASETADFILPINSYTSRVIVDIFDIKAPDNSDYAFAPNRLEINIQSAKRTAAPRPLQEFWWYPWDPGFPAFFGDSLTISIEDGPWTLTSSSPVTLPLADQPMEPGLMKVTLAGDISNESSVSFKIRITREGFRKPLKRPIATKAIHMDDIFWFPVNIPEGVTTATFDLHWSRDWSRFPTSDIDMVIFSPDGKLMSLDGATLNAPERATIDSPIKGLWFVLVHGFELYTPDIFELYLTTE
jgi:subtilisin family serine protease